MVPEREICLLQSGAALCRPWLPGLSELLDATVSDALFQHIGYDSAPIPVVVSGTLVSDESAAGLLDGPCAQTSRALYLMRLGQRDVQEDVHSLADHAVVTPRGAEVSTSLLLEDGQPHGSRHPVWSWTDCVGSQHDVGDAKLAQLVFDELSSGTDNVLEQIRSALRDSGSDRLTGEVGDRQAGIGQPSHLVTSRPY